MAVRLAAKSPAPASNRGVPLTMLFRCLLISLLPTLLCPAARALSAEDLVAPAHKIEPGRNDETWKPLFAQLAEKGTVFARFTEHRFLPFKKVPVVFTGEVRIAPDRGLSLHYITPEDRTMIVDAKGILLRDAQGRSREVPADPRAETATSALLHVMRFDLPELTKVFALYGHREGEAWMFAFEPLGTALARNLNRLVVHGDKAQLRKILIRRSAMQRVEITIDDVREKVAFDPAELKRFFR